MSTPRRRTPFLLALLLPVLAFAACADDGGSSSESSEPDAAEDGTTTTSEAAAAVGKGKGTFVVGDRTYAFDAKRCLADEGDPVGTVQADGEGTFDNRKFTVTVKSSPGETSVIETVQVVFAATEAVVGTNFVTLPGGAADVKLQVEEGGKAGGTMPVSGTGGQPSGDGVLTLECESA